MHVSKDAEEVNAVNYFTRTLPPPKEYYCEEYAYAVNDQTGNFQQNT